MTVPDQRVAQEAELASLRAEVARLQAALDAGPARPAQAAQPAEPPPSPPRRGGTLRWVGVGVLLALVALLAPLAVVATWVHDEISDTDRYVETVTPLAADPAVQDAVAVRVTEAIFTRLDVEAVTQEAVDALAEQGLPPRATASLSALVTPVVNGVHGFVEDAVRRLIRSDEFQQAWEAANREAHTQMVAVLTGKTGETIQVEGNTVSVNLAAVIDAVKIRLQDAGFALAERIPEVNAQFTIMESADITRAQTAFRTLSALARALPIVALVLLAAAVALAPSRRKALVIGAFVVAASMVLLGALLNAFRIVYLDAIPPERVPPAAAAAIYDQLVGFIRLNLRAVLVVFLAVALIAWLTGPWAPAAAVRRAAGRAADTVRHGSDRAGLNTGAFGVALYNMRTPLRAGVLGVAVVVYVMAAHPTGAFALTVLLVAGLVILVVELLARPPGDDVPDGVPDDVTAARPSGA
jgi:hypothetical protein